MRWFAAWNAIVAVAFGTPVGCAQLLSVVGAVRVCHVHTGLFFAGRKEARHAGKAARFQLRVERPNGLDGTSIVPAAFAQDVDVVSGSRPARPPADAVGAGQHEGYLPGR